MDKAPIFMTYEHSDVEVRGYYHEYYSNLIPSEEEILRIICPIDGYKIRSTESNPEPHVACKKLERYRDCDAHADSPACRWLEKAKAILTLCQKDDVCPECEGEGEIFHRGEWDTLKAWSRCSACKGTGKLESKETKGYNTNRPIDNSLRNLPR